MKPLPHIARTMQRVSSAPPGHRVAEGVSAMAEVVRCDICGKLFSSRHVNSHRRLAHGSVKPTGSPAEEDGMKMIVTLYAGLSAENKAKVRAKLTALEGEPKKR